MAFYEITDEERGGLEAGRAPDRDPFRVVWIATRLCVETPPRFRNNCLSADAARASLRPLALPIHAQGRSAYNANFNEENRT